MLIKPLLMFDFDGVLVNTLGVCYEINAENNPDLSLKEYQEVFSGNIYDSFGKGNMKNPHPDFHGSYAERTRELSIPEEVQAMLRRLAERYAMAVVSSTETPAIRKILARAGVEELFADVLGSDVDTSKVVKIKQLLLEHDVAPTDTVFVTDTAGDVYEAHECKVQSIGVTWGFQTPEMLEAANPLGVVHTLHELENAIEKFYPSI